MVDELKSNLEPIEEKDLDLKSKFVEQANHEMTGRESAPAAQSVERVERKEGTQENEGAYSKILSKVTTSAPVSEEHEVTADAKIAEASTDAESRITKLVELAEQKGVVHAVKVARKLEDNYALDEFHDRLLADDLHDALIKKGLLREL